MPRLSSCSSSWQRFSTTRVMLPVTTDSSIAIVSTSVSLSPSTFEKSALASTLPAMRSSTSARSRRSNSVSSAARALLQRVAGVEVQRLLLAHVGPARPVHQHVADAVQHRRNESSSRWIARSRQSPRIRDMSRDAGRGGLDSFVGVFTVVAWHVAASAALRR